VTCRTVAIHPGAAAIGPCAVAIEPEAVVIWRGTR
jgi:hypothetical protein